MSYWGHIFGVRVEADIRSDLFAHLQELEKQETALMAKIMGR
jgi:ATP-binding cassette subfamily B protein